MADDEMDLDKWEEKLLEEAQKVGGISEHEKKKALREESGEDLPFQLKTTLVQKARGQFGSMEDLDAKEELRSRIRDVLVMDDPQEIEKVLAEMKALYERLRGNTEFPVSIIMEELRSFYKRTEDALRG